MMNRRNISILSFLADNNQLSVPNFYNRPKKYHFEKCSLFRSGQIGLRITVRLTNLNSLRSNSGRKVQRSFRGHRGNVEYLFCL